MSRMLLAITTFLVAVTAAAPVERFTATAVTAAKPGTRPFPVAIEIVIDRWSSDAERDRLVETLKSKGPSGLLASIRAMPPVGNMSSTTSKGAPLRFAHARPAADGGRDLIMVTERPMGENEARSRFRRGDDYPFTIAEIHVDSGGSGEGKVAYAAHLVHDSKTGTFTIGNYAAEPVHLTSVKSERAR